jgi:hypothetical protein
MCRNLRAAASRCRCSTREKYEAQALAVAAGGCDRDYRQADSMPACCAILAIVHTAEGSADSTVQLLPYFVSSKMYELAQPQRCNH